MQGQGAAATVMARERSAGLGEGVPALLIFGGAAPSQRRALLSETVTAMVRQRQEQEDVRLAGLLAELRAAFAEDERGFTAQSDGPSGVLILSKGHFRGIWRGSEGQYSFTPGGYGAATYTAASAEEAVHYTLEHVCRDAGESRAAV
jgi:hypothetical protein